MDRKRSHVLIGGDFNFKEIDWEDEFVEVNQPDEDGEEEVTGGNQHISHFLETLQDLFLKQHVTEPTRYRYGVVPSLLDLIMTNEAGMVESLTYHPALGDSDHCCLKFKLNCYANTHKVKKKDIPNYYRADFTTIKNRLGNLDWVTMLNGEIKEDYPKLVKHLHLATVGWIPNRISPRKKNNMYMTNDAIRLKNKKHLLWKRYINTKSSYDHSAFVTCKNRLRNLTRHLRAEYENNIVRKIKSKPKIFWKYVNSKLKTREKIPTLNNMDGTFSVSSLEKAETLNKYFGSMFVDENFNNIPDPTSLSPIEHLSSIIFTKDMIQDKLQELNPNKSQEPDGWHPYFLRELSEELSKPLFILFQKSLKESVVPMDWLSACITAIYKKGEKDIPGNYRPISLTSALCKLLESIIKDFIIEHLTRNNLLAEEQHGFVPNRNCITNLLTAIEYWSSSMEGKSFDLIYTDFSKAFDSVPHARLMNKLKVMGITGEVLGWIKSFLTNRKQRVVVEGEMSSWSDVKSGIPQGSVLGPILFMAFINDLPDCILSTCNMFADDAKVYREINNPEDNEALQLDLDRMDEWSHI